MPGFFFPEIHIFEQSKHNSCLQHMSDQNEKLHRRSFLGKLSLGISALATFPLFSAARKMKEEMNTPSSDKQNTHPVLEVRPLGFQWETADPFLFCVHHEDFFPKGNDEMGPAASLAGRSLGDDFIIKDGWRMYHGKKVPGFPGHPHRGFETITVVRKGMVDHADSLGAAGRYGNGDVQWMTAGKGVQHSEMFPLLSKERDNHLELFQIWLNLPSKNKMVEPHFKMLWAEKIPQVLETSSNGKKVFVEVIAGTLKGKTAPAPPPDSWAANPENHVAVWNIKMEPGTVFNLPSVGRGINRTLYFYEGNGSSIEGKAIGPYQAARVNPEMNLEITAGDEGAGILVLQGRPINEQVMQYGPFVMNTKEEIHQAFEDFNRTRFGGWPWPRYDQVHDRSLGRFAKHADGTEERMG